MSSWVVRPKLCATTLGLVLWLRAARLCLAHQRQPQKDTPASVEARVGCDNARDTGTSLVNKRFGKEFMLEAMGWLRTDSSRIERREVHNPCTVVRFDHLTSQTRAPQLQAANITASP